MDRKFYVSLEVARVLKEKGYDRECIAYYQNGEFYPYSVNLFKLNINNKNAAPSYMNQYSAPTKAEAIDWLESKGVLMSSYPVTILCENSTTETHWSCHIVHKDGTWYTTNAFPTRLEAEDAAIIKALELLK